MLPSKPSPSKLINSITPLHHYSSLKSSHKFFAFLFTLILFTFYFLLFPRPSTAQSVGLSIYPPLLRVNIKPGKNITQAFNISYQGSKTKTFTARIVPFSARDALGIPTLEFNHHPPWLNYFSLGNSRISLGKPFTLEPGEKDQLIVSFKTPAYAEFGDIYAAVVLTATTPTATANSQIEAGIAANMIISLTDTYPPPSSIDITDFKPLSTPLLTLPGPIYIFDNLTPINFSATATNTGPHAHLIQGNFSVQGASAHYSLPLTEGYLLSNSIRSLTASSAATLTYHPQLTHIGKLQTQLTLNPEKPISSTLTLILLPIKAGISTILVLAIIFTIIRTTNKKYKQTPPTPPHSNY